MNLSVFFHVFLNKYILHRNNAFNTDFQRIVKLLQTVGTKFPPNVQRNIPVLLSFLKRNVVCITIFPNMEVTLVFLSSKISCGCFVSPTFKS